MAAPPTPPLPVTYTDAHHILAVQPDLTQVGVETVLEAAGMAEAEVNGYLAMRYALPLAPVPALVTTLTTDLAVCRIYTNRLFASPPRDMQTPWQDRCKAAYSMLMKLANGEVILVDAAGVPLPAAGAVASTSGEAWSTTRSYVPTFGEGREQTFVVDRNKIDNESSRRSW